MSAEHELEAAPVSWGHKGVFRRVFLYISLAFMVSMFYRGTNGVIAPELMAEPSMESVPVLLSWCVVQRGGARSPRLSAASRPVALQVCA